jgi:hypothetical protein
MEEMKTLQHLRGTFDMLIALQPIVSRRHKGVVTIRNGTIVINQGPKTLFELVYRIDHELIIRTNGDVVRQQCNGYEVSYEVSHEVFHEVVCDGASDEYLLGNIFEHGMEILDS